MNRCCVRLRFDLALFYLATFFRSYDDLYLYMRKILADFLKLTVKFFDGNQPVKIRMPHGRDGL